MQLRLFPLQYSHAIYDDGGAAAHSFMLAVLSGAAVERSWGRASNARAGGEARGGVLAPHLAPQHRATPGRRHHREEPAHPCGAHTQKQFIKKEVIKIN